MSNMPPSLSRLLYRFDCPAPHLLGEYQLDLLEPPQRVELARHVSSCEECTAELQTLRTFLASDPPLSVSFAEQARRVIASLLSPRPGLAGGLAGLRGTPDTATRQYQADDVTVTLDSGGAGSLVGLVTAETGLSGAAVRLLAHNQAVATATLDALGNFEIEGVPSGAYTLELELPQRTIVIEQLPID
jgi:hypothetical protein